MPSTSRLVWAIGLIAILMPSAATRAGGHGPACPECDCAICQPVATTLKEKEHTWQIECKQICIPVPRLWDKCCEPPCGKVKTVKVLKKVEYECSKCGYKWEIRAIECPCSK
jgi:hypothetical protein